ncbi:hypothetical protein GIB67_019113 [Kingdonia uniflora]|uniref:Uncharacterized protein n=1 Tax=Kingdonia uniflora TaxID=39325 RepID=A0A7J7MZW5_9MAGN|nr:hypothetical protein GIB67_019113 [Kingdonia uniflora]
MLMKLFVNFPDANSTPEDMRAIHYRPVFLRPHKRNNTFWIAIQKITSCGEPIGLKHFKPIRPLGCGDTGRLFLHDIRGVALRAVVAMGEEGDMVLVAGKGHETHQIEGKKREFFDDRDKCREALQYVDELHQARIDTSAFPWSLKEYAKHRIQPNLIDKASGQIANAYAERMMLVQMQSLGEEHFQLLSEPGDHDTSHNCSCQI